MTNVSEKLRKARTEAGITVQEISAFLIDHGIKAQPKTIYGWENGVSQPTPTAFLLMCEKYGITDVLAYFGYKGRSPLSLSRQEEEHIKKYSSLDDHGKRIVDYITTEEAERSAAPAAKLIPLQRSVWPASAGTGAYLGPEEMETIFVSDTPLTRRAAFCVPVQGNSMEPRYHDGDLLLVEGAEDVEPGEVGIFTIDGDGYVKVRGDGELISLNPEYQPIPMTESIWCNGRVIGTLDPALVE